MKNEMIPGRRWPIMLMAVWMVTAVWSPVQAQDKGLLDANIAVVNGVGLSRLEFDNQYKSRSNQFSSRGRVLSDVEQVILKQRIMKDMIDRQLLFQHSQKEGITPADAMIEEKLAELKKRFQDDAAFERAMQGLKMTQADITEKIKQDVAIETLIDQKIAPSLEVSETELQAYFEKIKPKIEEQLLREKRRQHLEKWLADARTDATIKKNLNLSLPPTVMNPPKPAP